MYRFPRDPARRAAWTAKVRRDKWTPSEDSVIFGAFLEFQKLLPTKNMLPSLKITLFSRSGALFTY